VIEGKAKRFKQEDGPEATQQYTAAQVSMRSATAVVVVCAWLYSNVSDRQTVSAAGSWWLHPAIASAWHSAYFHKGQKPPHTLCAALLPLQIAMMGGNVEKMLDGSSDPVGGGKAARGPATKPMAVTEFLDKGVGGAQLPRKQQDRKDKEKLKRAAGQSTHSQWKSEAEMVLRQQYD
jgi:hypothetical protein